MHNEYCRFLKHGLSLSPSGVSPCCMYYKGGWYKSLNIKKPFLNDIKENGWKKGEFCNKCEEYRQSSFDTIQANAEGITYLEVSLSLKCNLACPMCDENFSSTWVNECIKHNIPISSQIITDHKTCNDMLWNNLSLIDVDFSNITYIKIKGGEPFYDDKEHIRLLENIPYPENVELYYVTNFSLIPAESIINLWERFKLIKISASIDDVGERFDFLRWPYKWRKFQHIKDKMVNILPHNVMFSVERAITPLNINYIEELDNWVLAHFAQNRFNDKTELNSHNAGKKLSIYNIPTSMHEMLTEKYQHNKQISDTLKFIKPHINNDANIKQMIKYLDKLDADRGTNWRKVFTEIVPYYTKY